jgi:hypothetical protein
VIEMPERDRVVKARVTSGGTFELVEDWQAGRWIAARGDAAIVEVRE